MTPEMYVPPKQKAAPVDEKPPKKETIVEKVKSKAKAKVKSK